MHLLRQLSVQTSCAKFHANPTNLMGVDTRSLTDGRAYSAHKALFLLHKERLKAGLLIRLREINSFFWKSCAVCAACMESYYHIG
jgi:hypothetical protein